MYKHILLVLILVLAPLNAIAQEVYDPRKQLPANMAELDDKAKEKIRNEAVRQNLSIMRYDVSEFFNNDTPLDKPHIPRSYINAWSNLAALDIMTFGFHDHKERMDLASEYFTDEGWENFSQDKGNSYRVELVGTTQTEIEAASKGVPVLYSEDVVDGVFQWVMKVPLVLTFKSGSKRSIDELTVTLVIERTNDEKYPCGLAIKQWTSVEK